METVEYTIEPESNTVRAYLPDGRVLEIWSQAGWVQRVLHPANELSHVRRPSEHPCTREEFAAVHNEAQAQLQVAGELALPLRLDEVATGPYAVVAMVEPVLAIPLP